MPPPKRWRAFIADALVMKPVRVLVFAKAPHPGLAKTRLIPALGAERAAALARRMLDRTLAAALDARIGPVELCVEPDIHAPPWQGIAPPAGLTVSPQGGGDLGARMARAASRTLETGAPALLIGTDCTQMAPPLLRAAAAALARADAVMHPAADGGYALLGLARFHPSLFDRMAWSTATVAETTLSRIRALEWTVEIGATLNDVDVPADLVHLPPAWREECSAGGHDPAGITAPSDYILKPDEPLSRSL